ncbi:endocuticle structural glycoprotein SgAbd-2-like [Venturia canescens]|uniref:endocuticle structural glycoprotein SgAbd-2-like n=1 Tax=Venturia canescens TaxID=32260 RepID=UPI001C9C101B|nr:endocuticle structural glycoprotein SgAbd-2-like [Venturia canescens]
MFELMSSATTPTINMRYLIFASVILAIASGQGQFREPEKLVKGSHTLGDDLGKYDFTYETEGGIVQTEHGSRKYEGTPAETQLIQGSVQYNAPDGTPISLSWTADEFGTQVVGTHIPTPPPIPPAIQRALEWIAKQPSTTEQPEGDQTIYSGQSSKQNRNYESPKNEHQQFGNLKKTARRN